MSIESSVEKSVIIFYWYMIGSLVNPGTKGASAALIASVRPLKKLPRFLKNAMEREIATKLYVGVIKLYKTFHKLTVETES